MAESGSQAIKETRALVRQDPYGIGSANAAVGRQNLVGEEVDGKSAERKDR